MAPANRIDDIYAKPYGVGATVSFVDDGTDRYAADGVVPPVMVIGDVQTNYFWVVQARNSSGGVSGVNNIVGEFDFGLVKGS